MKKLLLDELIKRSREELAQLENAAKANRDFATDQEFKAESKLEIQILEEVDLDASRKLGEISIGALVELLHQNQKRLYFLIPTAGGTLLKSGNEAVLVVSVFSPIGDALLGLKAGDEFEVETPKETRGYQVLSFY